VNPDDTLRIPPDVAARLGFYVYLYVDPRNGKPFYVGKGQGNRVLSHMSDQVESEKTRLIAELAALGQKPQLDVLAHALPSEEVAFQVEAAAIDLLGLGNLANVVAGWQSVQTGRKSLEELVFYYGAKPVTITDPVILIRINRLYRHGMSDLELYEATRGVWKVGPRRSGARYGLAVFEGVVREVYEIRRWLPAGTLPYITGVHENVTQEGRWEFEGPVAAAPVREKYYGRSVGQYLTKGSQNPITYVNC